MSDAITRVQHIVVQAIVAGASDIHLEPTPHGLRIRYRIDGVLYDKEPVELNLMSQVLSRIKVLAGIDIAQRRVPQDGKFKLEQGGQVVDLRVSTFPAVVGEKLVIRILDRQQQPLKLAEIGLAAGLLACFERLIGAPSGFLLVTGPTGSGKTTTLYAALENLHTPDKNIITLEDPIEYHLEGITQGQIQSEAGFTFAKGVRSLLRQDPDVVMIGEIRDRESAKIAIEAALAGRMVFSTLHTASAPGAIMRLIDMGVESFLINAAVTGVLAQRLVRKLCLACRQVVTPTADEQVFMQRFNFPKGQLYRSTGCVDCHQLGHRGRTGIFELLLMTDELRELISQRARLSELEKQAISDGMITLFVDGISKILAGTISLAELVRVIV